MGSCYFLLISLDVVSQGAAAKVAQIKSRLTDLRISQIRSLKDYAKALVIRFCQDVRVLVYCSVQATCDKIMMVLLQWYFQSLFRAFDFMQRLIFIFSGIWQRVNPVRRFKLIIRHKIKGK